MPLASPATEPKRHWLSLPLWCPAGGVLSLSPADFAFSLLSAPIPPPPFPAGRGRLKVFLCKGLRPLYPPGLNPRGTYRTCQAGARSGALPLAGRGWVAFRYPAGGVAVLVARLPFTLALFLPPSPRPPSQREGGDFKVILCKGLRPLHPPGLNPHGTYRTCRCVSR